MAISNRLACATQQICACLFLAFAGVLPTTSSAHASTFTTIWNFKGGASDGAYPISAPGPAAAIGPDGSLFVTTSADGAHGYGAVVKLMPPASAKQPWTEQVIYSFAKNVGEPISVVAGGKGVLYGTWYAESPQCGFAFRLVEPANAIPPWTLTVLHTFTGGMDGCGPFGGLTRRADGYLYGSTLFGGGSSNCGNGCGTIYALKPQTAAGNWQSKIMLAFDGTNGSLPYDAPVLEKPLAEKTSRIIEPFWIMLLCADYDGDDHAGVLQEFSLPKTSNIVHGLLWNWEAGLLEGAYPMASPTPLPSGEQKSETDTTAQPTMVVGTTTGGGVETAGCLNQGNDGCGTVYELTVPTKKKQKWKLTNLHLFAGG